MLCLYLSTIIVYIILILYLSSETYSSQHKKQQAAKYSYPCMLKYYSKNNFVEIVWPAYLALFVYVLTHCIKTNSLTSMDTLYIQLAQRPRGNTLDWGASGSNLCSGKIFMFASLFCCYCVLFCFCPKNHYMYLHKILQFLLQC